MNCNNYIYNGQEYTKQEIMGILADKGISEIRNFSPSATIEDIKSTFGIRQEEDLLTYMERTNPEFLGTILSINNELDFEFNDTQKTSYSRADNKVNISLQELYMYSDLLELNPIDHLKYAIEHEFTHAAQVPAILQNPELQNQLNQLLFKLKALHKKNPFIDYQKGGATIQGTPKAFTDIFELASEAMSNPYLKMYLKQAVTKKDNLWTRFVNIFRELFGLTPIEPQSYYNRIDSLLSLDTISQDAIQNLENQNEAAYAFMPPNGVWEEFKLGVTNVMNSNKGEIEGLFDQMVEKLDRLRRSLSNETNYVQKKVLTNLLEDYNDIDQNFSKIDVGLRIIQNLEDITENVYKGFDEVDKIKDNNEKLIKLYSFITETDSFSDIIPLIQDISTQLRTSKNLNNYAKRFDNKLQRIIGVNQVAQRRFAQLAKPILIEELSVEESMLPIAEKLKKERQDYQDRLSKESNSTRKKILQDKIDRIETKLLKLPTKDNFERMFNSYARDVTFSHAHLVSMGLNSHFAIQQLTKMLHDKDIALSHRVLEVKNSVQEMMDNIKAKQSDVTTQKLIDELTQEVEVVISISEVEGKIKYNYTKTKSWKVDFTPDYIKTFTEYDKLLEFYRYKRRESPEYNTKYEDTLQEFLKWKKENVSTKYEDDYYKQFEILDEVLTKEDGTKTTLRKEKYQLYRDIEDIESQMFETALPDDVLQQIENKYQAARAELRDLLNPYDEQTNELKTGFKLKLHEQAKKHNEEKKKFIEYEQTEKSEKRHAKDLNNINTLFQESIETEKIALQKIQNDFDNNLITQIKYDQLKKRVEDKILSIEQRRDLAIEATYVSTPTEEFFKEQERLKKEVDSLMQSLIANDEIAQFVKISPVTDTFGNMSKRVSKYRDTDGDINGMIVTDNVREFVKKTEEEIELAKDTIESLGSIKYLSKSKSKEYDEISSKISTERTQDERLRLTELNAELKQRKEVYNKYKTDIDTYKKSLQDLFSMSTRSYTSYYYSQKDNIIKQLKKEAIQEINAQENIIEYLESFGYERQGSSFINPEGLNIGPNLDIVVETLAHEVAELRIESTDWFRNNHIQVRKFNEGEVYMGWEPIYIWRKTEPSDPNHIKKELAYKYRTPKILAKENADYRYVTQGLPQPKKSSKYYSLNTTNKNFKELRDQLRGIITKTEEDSGMFGSQRLYDILPGIAKHPHELTKDFTKKALTKEYYQNIKSNLFTKKTEDEQFAQGGTQSRKFKESKTVPFRFNKPLDLESQSNDLFYMAISYFQANSHAYDMVQLQPIFEAMLLSTKDLPTLKKAKTTAAKFSYKSIKSWFKSDYKPVNEEIKEGESNLHKTIQHLLNTYVYGEAKTNGLIGNVDTHKIASATKKLSSRMIFALKWVGPAKTLIAGKINFIINAQQGTNIFGYEDAVLGTNKSIQQIPDLLNDYRNIKFGNKSLTGQMIDFFQVLQGGGDNAYGRFTAFSALSEAGDMLSLPKHLSELELQLSAFNSISIANKLLLKDGSKVPFTDAFEIKDNKYQLKDGATNLDGTPVTQEDINKIIRKNKFINLIINGAFRADEKAAVEKHPLGSLAYYLNGFVVPGIINRYGNDWYSYMTEEVQTGHFRETLNFLRDINTYKGEIKYIWDELTPQQKNHIWRFVFELSAAIVLGALAFGLGSDDDTTELRKKNSIHLYLLAITMGVASELQTFIPVPWLGGDEVIRKMNNPFAVTRQLTTVYKLITSFLSYMNPLNDEGGIYKRDTYIKDGLHDKGMPKFIAEGVKLLGWSHPEFAPIERVQQMKSAQQIR